MIFVTIGSMFPFDRLIRVMDTWAEQTQRRDVLAQIGGGVYEPRYMDFVRRLPQAKFTETMQKAELIVAHAGMGSVITAGQLSLPIVILPRQRELGEVTSDHQRATARWLRDRPGVFVADTDDTLPDTIETALSAGRSGQDRLGTVADAAFTDKLRAAILNTRT